MGNNKQRLRDEQVYGHYYSYKYRDSDYCVYCGEIAQHFDHVLPISKAQYFNLSSFESRDELGEGLCKVPSCAECNHMLYNIVFFYIDDKREYVQNQLKKKYKKLLNMPNWEVEELQKLEGNLKQTIIRDIVQKKIIEKRVNYLNCLKTK